MLPFMTQPAVAAACYKPRAGSVIAQSQSFRGAQYLTRNFGAGNVNTWTFSVAFQRHAFGVPHYLLGTYIAQAENWLEVGSDDKAFACWRRSGGTSSAYKGGTKVHRDPSGFSRLTFQAENLAANLFHIFDGAAEVTYGSSAVGMTGAMNINTARLHYLGSQNGTYGLPQMALAEVYFIDGAALPPETFGEYNIHGVWVGKPKDEIYAAIATAGGFGTNGFHLDFSAPLQPGKDVSGRGNHWTAVGFDGTGKDTVPSTPTNVFATLNPLDRSSVAGATGIATITGGGLAFSAGSSGDQIGISSLAVPSTGKWSFAVKRTNSGRLLVGVGTALMAGWFVNLTETVGSPIYVNGVNTQTLASVVQSDTFVVEIDADAGSIQLRRNGAAFGAAQAVTLPAGSRVWVMNGQTSAVSTGVIDFGQAGHIPNAGFLTLCTDNLPEPDIKDPAEALAQATATGANMLAVLDAATAHWNTDGWVEIIKRRDASEDWRLRFSDDPATAWATNNPNAKAAAPALVAGGSYVGLRLRVGSKYGVYAAEVIHANGTATTVTHGLATARNWVMSTRVSAGGGDRWVRHPDLPAGQLFKLNSVNTFTDGTITAVGANSFQIAASAPSGTYRVLVLAERTGLISLGAYSGNSSVDGAFAPADVAPLLFMAKDTYVGSNSNWFLSLAALTSDRNPASAMFPNTTAIESAAYPVDLVVGGAKLRYGAGDPNQSGRTYCTIQIGRPVGGVCVAPATAR